MLPTDDDGFVITGTTGLPYGYPIGFLIKVTSTGNLQWAKYIRGDLSNPVHINAIERADGGSQAGFAVTGKVYPPSAPEYADLLLIKFDPAGTIICARVVNAQSEPAGIENGLSLHQNSDNTFTIGGESLPYPLTPLPILLKTDAVGNGIWLNRYELTAYHDLVGAESVEQLSDGGFAFVVNWAEDALAVKTTSTGAFEWAKEYGLDAADKRFCTVEQSATGGLIFAGTDDGIPDDLTYYLVRTENDGNSGCDQQDVGVYTQSLPFLMASALVFTEGWTPLSAPPTITAIPVEFEHVVTCECCEQACEDLDAAWCDPSNDGISFTVNDLTVLISIVLGDAPLRTDCGSEIDGYQNPYFMCNPTLGDLIAFQNYFFYGIGSIPPQDCICLEQPQNADLVMLIPTPIALAGVSGTTNPGQYTVILFNKGSVGLPVLGITVPLDFNTKIGPADVTATLENFQTYGVWDHQLRGPALEQWCVWLFGNAAPSALVLPAGYAMDLFDIRLTWTNGDPVAKTYVHPTTFTAASSMIPMVTAVAGAKSNSRDDTWPIAEVEFASGCGDEPGDANNDGAVDIDDVVYIIEYIFTGGPEPPCLAEGDADCSSATDIDDVVYLINYIFSGGPTPGDPDNDGTRDC